MLRDIDWPSLGYEKCVSAVYSSFESVAYQWFFEVYYVSERDLQVAGLILAMNQCLRVSFEDVVVFVITVEYNKTVGGLRKDGDE